MARLFRKSSRALGLPPGTLVFKGEQKTQKAKITVIVTVV